MVSNGSGSYTVLQVEELHNGKYDLLLEVVKNSDFEEGVIVSNDRP
jgi:hypothetical protein